MMQVGDLEHCQLDADTIESISCSTRSFIHWKWCVLLLLPVVYFTCLTFVVCDRGWRLDFVLREGYVPVFVYSSD